MTDVPTQRSNDPYAGLSVIIVAAGQSTRMEGVDKLALDIGSRSILWHSLEVVDRSPLVSGGDASNQSS
ncbi:MAG: NTP transferase domain-containing protein [Chloroflexi bacterium]|nr:NTP transferase domain-containing protein [Chloroflexota bacterium]